MHASSRAPLNKSVADKLPDYLRRRLYATNISELENYFRRALNSKDWRKELDGVDRTNQPDTPHRLKLTVSIQSTGHETNCKTAIGKLAVRATIENLTSEYFEFTVPMIEFLEQVKIGIDGDARATGIGFSTWGGDTFIRPREKVDFFHHFSEGFENVALAFAGNNVKRIFMTDCYDATYECSSEEIETIAACVRACL